MKIRNLFAEYEVYALARGMSTRTLERYRDHIFQFADFVGDREVEEIQPRDIRGYLAHLADLGYAPWTVHRNWTALRSLFRFAADEYGIRNPAAKVPMPKVAEKEVEPFHPVEIQKLLEAALSTRTARTEERRAFRMSRPTWLRDQAILLMLLDTGIRITELCNLLVGDVNLETGEVRIKKAKGGKNRTVIIGKKTREVLKKYLDVRSAEWWQPLFLTQNGRPFDKNSLGRLLRRLGERAGVRRVHAHRFRHTFAIMFLRNGGNIFALQRLLGHSTMKMVNHYLAIALSDLHEQHSKASPVDNMENRIRRGLSEGATGGLRPATDRGNPHQKRKSGDDGI